MIGAAWIVALGSGHARAQFAGPDPFPPNLQGDPRKPQQFQTAPRVAQTAPTTTFAPYTLPAPASGAGDTGFDSTNVHKKKPKAKAKSTTAPAAAAAAPPS